MIHHPSGTRHWMRNKFLIPDHHGGMELVGGISIDISDAKRAEEALRESEEGYRTLFNSINDGILIIDPEGRILEVNEVLCRRLDYSREELLRRRVADIDPPEFAKLVPERTRAILEGGSAVFETAHLRRDGISFPTEISSRITTYQGQTAILSVARDITERKRAEAEILRLHSEVTELLKAKSIQLVATADELEGFAHSMSHDLRAPIRRINGLSNALLEDYGETLDDTGRQYLNTVRAEVQSMGEHVDAMLDISRVAGRELVMESVDLGATVESLGANLVKKYESRNVQFVIPEGLIVQGDAGLLRTLLKNLLENALKATARLEEGARIEQGVTKRGGVPVYFVRDNGMGFNMAYAGKLFRPFQKLHKDEEFPGMGIGLAVVLRIIRRHGGTIWAEGEVGNGATFYFTLGQ